MDCRTTPAHKFRTRLGFKQYDVILTKVQLPLTIISSSEGENMQTQYNVFNYSIDIFNTVREIFRHVKQSTKKL